VTQVAALHSPEDVQVCVLTGTAGRDAWEWVRWLPHCRPALAQNCTVLIGTGAAAAGSGDLGAAGAGPVTPQVCLINAAQAGAPFIRKAR
jgi:hypothetical protein